MTLPDWATQPALPFPVETPFVEHLSLELLAWGSDDAQLRVTVQGAHLNSFGVAHGGLSMTLLDVVMAYAARGVLRDAQGQAPGVVTVELKTSFFLPVEGCVRAVGSVVHRTPTLLFTQGWIEDTQGRRLAHATATFKPLRALPSAARQARGWAARGDAPHSQDTP